VLKNQVILHDLRDDRYGEIGFHCRRSSAKKPIERLSITRRQLIDKESLKINILEWILIENAERIFSGPALAPARTRPCGGEPAKPGNRLTAGLGGRRESAGQDIFLLRVGLNRKVAGHCARRGAFERDGRRSWLN
jgi:hypothetical protein